MASSGVIAELLRLDEEEKRRSENAPYQQQQQIMQGILQGLQLYDAVKSVPLKYGTKAVPGKEAVPASLVSEPNIFQRMGMGGVQKATTPGQLPPEILQGLLSQGRSTIGGQPIPGFIGPQNLPAATITPGSPGTVPSYFKPAQQAVQGQPAQPGLYQLQSAGEIGKILAGLQVEGPGAAQLGQSLSTALGLAPGTTVKPRPQMVTIGAEKDPTSPTGYKAITVETPARSKVSPTMNVAQKTQAEIDKEKREEEARIRREERGKVSEIEKEERAEKRKKEETTRKAAMEVWKKGLDMKRKREPLPKDFREAFFNAGRALGEDITPFIEEGSKGLAAALDIQSNKYIEGFAKFRVPDGKGGFEEGRIIFDPLTVEEFKKRYPGAIEIP